MDRDELRILRHPDPRSFLDRADPWLLLREAENNLVLGLADSLSESTSSRWYGSPLYFATVERGGGVVGCAFRTPPYKLGLTRMPLEAAPLLARDLAEVYETLPAVLGPGDLARAVADSWAGMKGVRAVPGMRQRIHRLDRVRFPSPVAPGDMRLASGADVPLLVPWLESFLRATGLRKADPEAAVRRLVDDGLMAVWVHGHPVSMAAFHARTRNAVRIGYVYTPVERRRKGYASALVAHLSSHILDSGFRHCVLYTDLANPTSNRIYRAVGYRPVQDVMDVNFV